VSLTVLLGLKPTKTTRSGAVEFATHGFATAVVQTAFVGSAHFSTYEYFCVLPCHFVASIPVCFKNGMLAPSGLVPLNHWLVVNKPTTMLQEKGPADGPVPLSPCAPAAPASTLPSGDAPAVPLTPAVPVAPPFPDEPPVPAPAVPSWPAVPPWPAVPSWPAVPPCPAVPS
jgi:hypothetical protein